MERLARINEIEGRLDALEARGSAITQEETTEVVNLMNELETLDAEERAMQKFKARKLDAVKKAAKSPEEKLAERFSFMKVIRSLAENKSFTGPEAEVHAEGVKQARESQVGGVLGFALPTNIPVVEQRTTLTAGTAATAANLIATELYDVVPALRPNISLVGLGAQVMTGLIGNVDIPAGDALATASFNTESGAAAETNPNTKKVSLSPKRLAAYTDMTLQMMYQSSVGLENWVVSELTNAEARKIDQVGILGGGTNEPTGILGMAGTNTVAIDTNGGNITRAKLIEMMTAIENENASGDNMAYLTTPGVKGFLMNLISSAGVGPFVWQDNNTILGYNAVASNHVPKNLVKGNSTAICHAVIFGSFNKLIIGNWGVRDITVDNVTRKVNGEVRIVINSFWDVKCVHPKSFSVIKDALI